MKVGELKLSARARTVFAQQDALDLDAAEYFATLHCTLDPTKPVGQRWRTSLPHMRGMGPQTVRDVKQALSDAGISMACGCPAGHLPLPGDQGNRVERGWRRRLREIRMLAKLTAEMAEVLAAVPYDRPGPLAPSDARAVLVEAGLLERNPNAENEYRCTAAGEEAKWEDFVAAVGRFG